MQVAKSTVKVLESGEKLIKKQANSFASGKIFHKDSSPHSSPKISGTLRDVQTNVSPEDTKAECICTYKKDLGKLIVTQKYLKFRSLHFDEMIHFDKVSSVRKKGPQKIVLKLKDDQSCSFGPFDDVRRGVIYEIIRTIHDYNGQNPGGGGGGGININAIPGLNDKLTKDLFGNSNIPDIVPGTFKEPTEADAPCIDEVFDIPLKNLFALVFSDSSTFLTELQTKQGDSGMSFSKWELSEANACYSRQFDFVKKNKLATATVHQTQLCRLKSPTELLFETSNKMENVPFSDSFTVDTKWRVTQEGDKTRIKVWVRVDFKKSVSFIKGKIESGSVSATQDYFKEYAAFLRKTLSSGGDDRGIDEPEIKTAKKSSFTTYLTIAAILILVPLGLYYLWGLISFINISFTSGDDVTTGTNGTTAQSTAQLNIEELLRSVQQQIEIQSNVQFVHPDGSVNNAIIENLEGLHSALVSQLRATSDLLHQVTEFLESKK